MNAASSLALVALFAAPTFGPVASFNVGGEGGWDYLMVDSAAHRVYVSRSSHVMVIDSDSGKLVGDLPDTAGVHGIAIARKLGRGYTSNGRTNDVTVFDPKTLAKLGTIPVGANPDAILYDEASNRLVTCNGRSADLTVLDPKTQKIVGTVALGGKPEAVVVDGGTLYVNVESTSEIARVDLKTAKLLGKWSIAPGEEPSGLALDAKRHRLFAVCANGLMAVVDDRTGKVVATPKIGEGPDAAAYDPKLDLAFSSNGEGTLSVVARDAKGGYATVATVPTAPTARTMALDPRTHRIYLSAATPAPATTGGGRRAMVPGSFRVLVMGPLAE